MNENNNHPTFSVDIQPLKEALQALNFAAKKSPIFLFPQGDSLVIDASDTDAKMSVSIPCESNGWDGAAMSVYGKGIIEKLKNLSCSRVTATYDGAHAMKFTHDNGMFKLTCTYYADYSPTRNSADMLGGHIYIGRDALAESLKIASPFSCKNAMRRVMCGVLLDAPENGELWAVASDGRTLVKYPIPMHGHAVEKGFRVMIPDVVIAFLLKFCKKGECNAKIQKSEDGNEARIICGGAVVRFDDLSLQYPNYNSVIPAEDDFRVKARVAVSDIRDALISCVGKTNAENSKRVDSKFACDMGTFTYEDDILEVKNRVDFPLSDDTEGSIDFACTSYNMQRIVDGLKEMRCKDATFCFIDNTSNCVVRPIDITGSVFLMAPSYR